jgi:hypothetical protein
VTVGSSGGRTSLPFMGRVDGAKRQTGGGVLRHPHPVLGTTLPIKGRDEEW